MMLLEHWHTCGGTAIEEKFFLGKNTFNYARYNGTGDTHGVLESPVPLH